MIKKRDDNGEPHSGNGVEVVAADGWIQDGVSRRRRKPDTSAAGLGAGRKRLDFGGGARPSRSVARDFVRAANFSSASEPKAKSGMRRARSERETGGWDSMA